MPRAPRFQLMMTPSVVTPMIASRETSTMPCKLESSSFTPVSCSRLHFHAIHTRALATIWAREKVTTNSVRADPNKPGARRQIARTVGITKTGMGHSLRLKRGIELSLFKNMLDIGGSCHVGIFEVQKRARVTGVARPARPGKATVVPSFSQENRGSCVCDAGQFNGAGGHFDRDAVNLA